MFSLNVPLPPAIGDFAADLHPKLSGFDRVRDRHTLVCKRLGVEAVPDRVDGNGSSSGRDGGAPSPPKPDALAALREDLRPLLSGTGPFDAAATEVDVFDAPASGSRPVVYLAVESDALVRLHHRLCAAYDAIEGIEGDDFVPHVTLARGGNPDPGVVADLVNREFEPIRWRVHAMEVYDPEFREVAATIEL
ncbi:2'-5' RNA ligase family protein [Halorubrum rutilum]|uniref:2'-5' RNA ligase family protein n=1 Tax=Halorubrum rutilum TaxID=1364933 RepID=A0ABD6AM43_9EURY|nr:2'-5' RNA ligase family protein [Halorubrum rutilum]